MFRWDTMGLYPHTDARQVKMSLKGRLSPTYLLVNTPSETLLDAGYGRAIASSLLQSLYALSLRMPL